MEAIHPKYRPGQVWSYRTRVGEEQSRVTILRVDREPSAGYIVHLAVDGLSIKNPTSRDGVARTISHLPFSEKATDQSLTDLLDTGPIPDYQEGYQTWREGFERGEAGVWSIPVEEVVAAMETVLGQSN
jgi:hypothetical protein